MRFSSNDDTLRVSTVPNLEPRYPAGGVTHIGLGVPELPSMIFTGNGEHAEAANRHTGRIRA